MSIVGLTSDTIGRNDHSASSADRFLQDGTDDTRDGFEYRGKPVVSCDAKHTLVQSLVFRWLARGAHQEHTRCDVVNVRLNMAGYGVSCNKVSFRKMSW